MAIKQLSPVPPLPANYAERRGLGGAVAQSLQKCLQASGLCLVHGAGGMGKTVQTCATIHQETVLSEIFPDGVAYVTVGQSPDLVHLQSQLLRAFGVFEAPTDLSDGYAKLFGALAGRKALLILDDVWDAQHLEFLVPLKGRPKSWLQNAVLITSRRVDLLGSAELLRLGELTEEEAQQLLKLEGDLPLVAKLAKLCSKSPLALSILGATGLREEERTSSKRSSIFNSFLTELTGRKEEPNAVKRCIELCSKRLSSEELELYLDLAVFPDDVLLPVGALRNIFAGRDLEALKELERLHLLGMESSGDEQLVRLHDLSLEFVKEHAVKRGMGEKKLHEDLLENYSRCLKAPRNWWTGPDDGYFFQRLLYHLSLAGRGEEGRALLLRWEWMASRLRRPGDVIAVVAELKAFAPKGSLRPSPISGSGTAAATALGSSQQAKARATTRKAAAKPKGAPKAAAQALSSPSSSQVNEAPADGIWNALVEVLTLSAHILAEDPSQLPFQVLGRLLGFEEEPGGTSSDGALQELRARATGALEAGVYPVFNGKEQWKASICPVSPGTLQGVGGPLQRTLQLHQDWVRSLAVNRDGTLLASASNDLSVKVWDLTQDCRMLLELLGHRTAVLTVDLNGDTVLSGDKDEAILWSLEGSLLRRWGGFEGGLNVVLFVGPDEAALAVHHEVQVISTSSSTSFKTVRLPHDVRVAALAARNFPGSAGDLLLACGCVDAHATLWRLAKGKSRKGTGIEFSPSFLLRFPAGDQDVRAISLSASGDLLAAGNDDTRMRLWKIQPKKAEISIEPLCTAGLHTDWIHSVSTADGSLVASGADDNSIALYDVQAQRLVGRVRIFSGAFCVVLSPNGHWLFSASGDIRVWSVPKMIQETHKSRTAFRRHVVPISALAMRRDGREALAVSGDVDETGTPNGGLQLSRWDCATASQLSFCIIPGSKEDDDRPLCLSLSPNGSACAVGCDTGKLWVLALDGTAVWETEAHSERIHCCEWLEDDSIATGSEDGSVCCWSLELRACRAQCRPYEGNGPVRCFAWTHDRERVLCGGDYQHPRLVHLAGPGEDGYMAMEYQDVLRQELTVSTSCSLALSSDDRRAVTCSWDKALRLFDVDTGQLLLVVTQVSDWVVKGFGATLAGDSAGLCVSYAWDQQLQLWDLGLSARGSGCRVVEAKDAPERLCACQCDASLVRMACAPRWTEGVRRSLAFSDEEGAVHFFKVELVPPASGE